MIPLLPLASQVIVSPFLFRRTVWYDAQPPINNIIKATRTIDLMFPSPLFPRRSCSNPEEGEANYCVLMNGAMVSTAVATCQFGLLLGLGFATLHAVIDIVQQLPSLQQITATNPTSGRETDRKPLLQRAHRYAFLLLTILGA